MTKQGRFVEQLEPRRGDALLIVDVQRDFLPNGALPVDGGDEIISSINRYIELFQGERLPIVATRDWHPANHCSFKSQGGPWPVHCVAGSSGARMAEGLQLPETTHVTSKGTETDKEAYSGFSGTDLATFLRENNITHVFVCGLATDYCVLETVKDAVRLGFNVTLLSHCVRPVNVEAGRQAIRQMIQLGADIYEPA